MKTTLSAILLLVSPLLISQQVKKPVAKQPAKMAVGQTMVKPVVKVPPSLKYATTIDGQTESINFYSKTGAVYHGATFLKGSEYLLAEFSQGFTLMKYTGEILRKFECGSFPYAIAMNDSLSHISYITEDDFFLRYHEIGIDGKEYKDVFLKESKSIQGKFVVYSSDGKYIASVKQTGDPSLKIWDKAGNCLFSAVYPKLNRVFVDGAYFLVTFEDGSVIKIDPNGREIERVDLNPDKKNKWFFQNYNPNTKNFIVTSYPNGLRVNLLTKNVAKLSYFSDCHVLEDGSFEFYREKGKVFVVNSASNVEYALTLQLKTSAKDFYGLRVAPDGNFLSIFNFGKEWNGLIIYKINKPVTKESPVASISYNVVNALPKPQSEFTVDLNENSYSPDNKHFLISYNNGFVLFNDNCFFIRDVYIRNSEEILTKKRWFNNENLLLGFYQDYKPGRDYTSKEVLKMYNIKNNTKGNVYKYNNVEDIYKLELQVVDIASDEPSGKLLANVKVSGSSFKSQYRLLLWDNALENPLVLARSDNFLTMKLSNDGKYVYCKQQKEAPIVRIDLANRESKQVYTNKSNNEFINRFEVYKDKLFLEVWKNEGNTKEYSLLNPNTGELQNLDFRGVIGENVLTANSHFLLSKVNGNGAILDESGKIISTLDRAGGNFNVSRDGQSAFVAGRNTIKYYNLKTQNYINVGYNNQGDWVFYTDEGYFEGNNRCGDIVGLSQGISTFGIDQMATIFNRPDIIWKRMGWGNNNLINHYNKQYLKRLKKIGLSEKSIVNTVSLPTAQIVGDTLDGKGLTLKLFFKDKVYALKSYNVYVNDVPLFGAAGKTCNNKEFEVTEKIQLCNGKNKIEVSCTNEKGYESLRPLVNKEISDQTPKDLYLLALGVSKYKNPSLNLQYAHKDALDLEKVIQAYKGKGFENVYTEVLTNEQVTPEAIKTAKDFVKDAKPDDTFILFIAGHGMHDKDAEATYYYLTYGADVNNLKATAADFETVEDLLQGIPPRNKLFLMDACESGEIDDEDQGQMLATAIGAGVNSRGFKAAASTTLSPLTTNPQQLTPKRSYLYQKDRYIYNDLVRRSGAIVFSSSKGGELSYERSDIENGLFTEYIMKALTTNEADKDGNGIVSTDELRDYVSAQVAKASGDLQHPTVDRDNIYQKFGFGVK